MAAQWNPPLQKVMDDLRRALYETFQESSVVLGNRIIRKTPVDTGHLQHSWLYKEGSPDLSPSAEGRHPKNRYPRKTLPLKLGGQPKNIYLTNNAPYARYQEFGGRGPGRFMMSSTIPDFPSIVSQVLPRKFR